MDEKYYSKSFQFLSLGAMAYIGESLARSDCLLYAYALGETMKALEHCRRHCGNQMPQPTHAAAAPYTVAQDMVLVSLGLQPPCTNGLDQDWEQDRSAFAGSDRAVTQLEAGKAIFDLAGYVSFLLWRSVYVTKQVRAVLTCML